jgi:hypothetical protein
MGKKVENITSIAKKAFSENTATRNYLNSEDENFDYFITLMEQDTNQPWLVNLFRHNKLSIEEIKKVKSTAGSNETVLIAYCEIDKKTNDARVFVI